ncbi:hypothetical protein HDU96_007138 [Phlyctochytrium bullatum]|nr:hypothetical protein HDU96_007138 [Phlyctochytrium bullatum]
MTAAHVADAGTGAGNGHPPPPPAEKKEEQQGPFMVVPPGAPSARPAAIVEQAAEEGRSLSATPPPPTLVLPHPSSSHPVPREYTSASSSPPRFPTATSPGQMPGALQRPQAPPHIKVLLPAGGSGVGSTSSTPATSATSGVPEMDEYGDGAPVRKRKQVKNACVNCQKACKKCDTGRPCPRCVRYGLQDTCQDSVRKERRKGIKRGPYKPKLIKAESDTSSRPHSPDASALPSPTGSSTDGNPVGHGLQQPPTHPGVLVAQIGLVHSPMLLSSPSTAFTSQPPESRTNSIPKPGSTSTTSSPHIPPAILPRLANADTAAVNGYASGASTAPTTPLLSKRELQIDSATPSGPGKKTRRRKTVSEAAIGTMLAHPQATFSVPPEGLPPGAVLVMAPSLGLGGSAPPIAIAFPSGAPPTGVPQGTAVVAPAPAIPLSGKGSGKRGRKPGSTNKPKQPRPGPGVAGAPIPGSTVPIQPTPAMAAQGQGTSSRAPSRKPSESVKVEADDAATAWSKLHILSQLCSEVLDKTKDGNGDEVMSEAKSGASSPTRTVKPEPIPNSGTQGFSPAPPPTTSVPGGFPANGYQYEPQGPPPPNCFPLSGQQGIPRSSSQPPPTWNGNGRSDSPGYHGLPPIGNFAFDSRASQPPPPAAAYSFQPPPSLGYLPQNGGSMPPNQTPEASSSSYVPVQAPGGPSFSPQPPHHRHSPGPQGSKPYPPPSAAAAAFSIASLAGSGSRSPEPAPPSAARFEPRGSPPRQGTPPNHAPPMPQPAAHDGDHGGGAYGPYRTNPEDPIVSITPQDSPLRGGGAAGGHTPKPMYRPAADGSRVSPAPFGYFGPNGEHWYENGTMPPPAQQQQQQLQQPSPFASPHPGHVKLPKAPAEAGLRDSGSSLAPPASAHGASVEALLAEAAGHTEGGQEEGHEHVNGNGGAKDEDAPATTRSSLSNLISPDASPKSVKEGGVGEREEVTGGAEVVGSTDEAGTSGSQAAREPSASIDGKGVSGPIPSLVAPAPNSPPASAPPSTSQSPAVQLGSGEGPAGRVKGVGLTKDVEGVVPEAVATAAREEAVTAP